MFTSQSIRATLTAAGLAAALLSAMPPAEAATTDPTVGLTVEVAALRGGKLVVKGVTKRPSTVVSLDTYGVKMKSRNRTAPRPGAFAFFVTPKKGECEIVLSIGANKTKPILVSGCGPVGPQGPAGPEGMPGAPGAPAGQAAYDAAVAAGTYAGSFADWQMQYLKGPAGQNGLGFTMKGAWVEGGDYAVNDVVRERGSAYVRVSTDGDPLTPPSKDPQSWNLLAAGVQTTPLIGLLSNPAASGEPSFVPSGADINAAVASMQFISPTVEVDLSAGDTLTASLASALWLADGGTQELERVCFPVVACWQHETAAAPTLIDDNTDSYIYVSALPTDYNAVSAIGVAPSVSVAGKYKVGLCAMNSAYGYTDPADLTTWKAVDANAALTAKIMMEAVTGYVQVSRQQWRGGPGRRRP